MEITEKIEYNRSLSNRKEFYRPLDSAEINSHEDKYLKSLKLNQSIRQQKIKEEKLDRLIHETKLNFYKPKIKIILENEEEIRLSEQKLKKE